MLYLNIYKSFNVILCVLLCSFACSCSNAGNQTPLQNKSSHKPPYNININKNRDNYKKVMLSEVADSISYVALETNKECVMSSPRVIKLTSDYIFLSDFNNLYKFNRRGKFIGKIGKKGSGPGEYKNIRTFTVDKANKLLFVVFHWKHEIAIYDFDGNYIRSVKFYQYTEDIEVFDDKHIALSGTCSGSERTKYNLFLLNYHTWEIIMQYADYYNITGMHSFKFSSLRKLDHHLYFNDTFCDTLFIVNSQAEQSPYCIFDMDELKIMETSSFPANVHSVQRIIPTKNNIYFLWASPLVDNFLHSSIYNIETDEMCNITPSEDSYKGVVGFYNDFDGLLHLWPKFIGENGEMISYYEIDILKELSEANKKNNIKDTSYFSDEDHDTISNIIKKSKIEDNGVVAIVYLK